MLKKFTNTKYPILEKIPTQIMQMIGTFLNDKEITRVAAVNNKTNKVTMNLPYGLLSDDKGSSTHMTLKDLGILKSRVRALSGKTVLTVPRGIANLTPETFRGAYSLGCSLALGTYACAQVIPIFNDTIHDIVGETLFGNALCATFVTGVSAFFGANTGRLIGEKIGEFNYHNEYDGMNIGALFGLVIPAGISLYYGAKNFLIDYQMIPDISYNIVDNTLTKGILAAGLIATTYGLFINKKKHINEDAADKKYLAQFRCDNTKESPEIFMAERKELKNVKEELTRFSKLF